MSSVKHTLYRKELLNYVNSLNIKFSPYAEMVKNTIYERDGVDIKVDIENPYYLNLAGMYSSYDTMMYIPCIETNTNVPFTMENLKKYPKTASLYTPGSEEYVKLCNEYPNSVGLIKCIIYPAKSLEAVLQAEELSILNQDESFLQENERESLVNTVNEFISYMKYRWFVYDFNFENQYPLVFMGTLYSLIYAVLEVQRITNLHTDACHINHVWDYLIANGLGDYETVLSQRQARFFYRNMRYLRQHRGQLSNLEILADNLLKDLKVDLVGKLFLQQNKDETKECITIPEVLSEDIKVYTANTYIDVNTVDTIDSTLRRLYIANEYPKYSLSDSEKVTTKFSRTTQNTLPTRLLEFRKYTIDAAHRNYASEFLFDSLYYKVANNKVDYLISFKDTNSAIQCTLHVREALALIHYLCYKRYMFTQNPDVPETIDPVILKDAPEKGVPVYLPTNANVRLPYLLYKPDNDKQNLTYFFNGFKYRMDTIVDVDTVLKDIPWSDSIYTSPKALMLSLEEQFSALKKHTDSTNLSSSLLYQRAFAHFYKKLVYQGIIKLDLIPGYTTYQEWFDSNKNIKELIKTYENLNPFDALHNNLMDTIIGKILPVEYASSLGTYLGTALDDTDLYDAFKKLFIEWTSYDLTYLDTDRSITESITLMPISIETTYGNDASSIQFGTENLGAVSDAVDKDITVLDNDSTNGLYIDDISTKEQSILDINFNSAIMNPKHFVEQSDMAFLLSNLECRVDDQIDNIITPLQLGITSLTISSKADENN